MFDSLMDALGYVGSSLDKLGPRPMRGLLAGRPRELASFVPFSDEMGLTDPHDIASGRDVTDRFGMTRKGANDLGSHAVGMLADALIDPAMAAGGVMAGLKGAKALYHLRTPPVGHALHELAAGATHLNPMQQALMAKHRQGGALKFITPQGYLSMLGDEGTPLGRLNALAESAGTHVYPGPADVDRILTKARAEGDRYGGGRFHAAIARAAGPDEHAVFTFGQHKGIVPNIVNHPDLWSDLGAMAADAERQGGSGWMSTRMPEHLAIHEIGHALHSGTPSFHSATEWPQAGVGGLLADSMLRRIGPQVSHYALSNPREFVAEAFAKQAQQVVVHGYGLGGFAPRGGGWLSPDLFAAYRALYRGPKVPRELADQLARYLDDPVPAGPRTSYPSAAIPTRGPHPSPDTVPALGLKYDALDTPPPGLARTDPEWVNNKTWYHGSGTPGLTADALDPRRSSGANSLGRGIYTAGSPATLESHKAKGFDDAIRKALTQQRDPDWIDALSGRVEAGEFAREPWAAGLSHGRQVGTLDDMVRQLLYKAAGDPTGRRRLLTPDDQALLARVGLGLPRATAYQAQSGFGSILDVDLPNDDLFRALAGSVEQAGHQPLAPTGRIGDAYAASIDRLGPDQTLRVARQSGYDALIGSGRDPHGGGLAQVLVGLDPNDVYGLGRRTPYRRWESFHG